MKFGIDRRAKKDPIPDDEEPRSLTRRQLFKLGGVASISGATAACSPGESAGTGKTVAAPANFEPVPETATAEPTAEATQDPTELQRKFLDALSVEEFRQQPPEMRALWGQGMYEKLWVTEINKYKSFVLAASVVHQTDPNKRYAGDYLLAGDQTGNNGQEVINRSVAEEFAVYAIAEHGDMELAEKAALAAVYDPDSSGGKAIFETLMSSAARHYEQGEVPTDTMIIRQMDVLSRDGGIPGIEHEPIDIDGQKLEGRVIITSQSGNTYKETFVPIYLPTGELKYMPHSRVPFTG